MGQYIATVAEVMAICGVIGGFLGWLLTGLLSNKKDTITNTVNIQHLNERLKDLEKEVDDNRKEFEHYKDNKNH